MLDEVKTSYYAEFFWFYFHYLVLVGRGGILLSPFSSDSIQGAAM